MGKRSPEHPEFRDLTLDLANVAYRCKSVLDPI